MDPKCIPERKKKDLNSVKQLAKNSVRQKKIQNQGNIKHHSSSKRKELSLTNGMVISQSPASKFKVKPILLSIYTQKYDASFQKSTAQKLITG